MITDGGRAYRCAKCGVTKPLTLEHFCVDYRGNVSGYCRPCQRAYCRQYDRDLETDAYLRERRRAYHRQYYRRANQVDPANYRVGRLEDGAA